MREGTLGLSPVDGASKRHRVDVTVHGDGHWPRIVRGHDLCEEVLGQERHTPRKQEKVEQLPLHDEVKDKYGGVMGDLRVCDLVLRLTCPTQV